MAARIQFRRGLAANWTSSDRILSISTGLEWIDTPPSSF